MTSKINSTISLGERILDRARHRKDSIQLSGRNHIDHSFFIVATPLTLRPPSGFHTHTHRFPIVIRSCRVVNLCVYKFTPHGLFRFHS